MMDLSPDDGVGQYHHAPIADVEELILLSNNESLRRRFTASLTAPRFKWKEVDLVLSESDVVDAARLRDLFDPPPASVLIDYSYPKADVQTFSQLSACKPSDLREIIDAGSSLPASIHLLRTIHAIRQNRGLNNLLVFFLIDQTSTSLSHALLRIGADWLFPPGDDPKKLGEIVANLRSLQSQVVAPEIAVLPKTRGRVFVAENSRNVCLALRTRLDRYFDLRFVGEEKPGNRFEISTDEALEAFTEGIESGGYIAAIIDLALNDNSEEQAKQRFASDDAASRTFSQQNWQLIHEIFGGVRLIAGIRRLAPKLPIFVFSNYIHSRNVAFIINGLVGRDIWSSVEPVGKSEKGYRYLREELFRLGDLGSPEPTPKGVQ